MRISDWSSDVCSSDLRDHDVGLAVLDLVAQLAFGIERAVVHHPAAGLEDGEEADHVMRRVGQEQADMHAGTDAELLEALGGPVDQVGDGGVRSEERRGGNGCVRKCRFRWEPYHLKK